MKNIYYILIYSHMQLSMGVSFQNWARLNSNTPEKGYKAYDL